VLCPTYFGGIYGSYGWREGSREGGRGSDWWIIEGSYSAWPNTLRGGTSLRLAADIPPSYKINYTPRKLERLKRLKQWTKNSLRAKVYLCSVSDECVGIRGACPHYVLYIIKN
jgi:hypothetical protein